MPHLRRAFCTLAAVAATLVFSGPASGGQGTQAEPPTTPAATVRDGDRKPSLSLKANPPVGFSPLRVRLVVEITKGADDYADFYCPSIEWDWGDGTVSESSEDCDPYVAGKSTIRRRYTADHTYRIGDNYRLLFKLKQKSRVVGAAQANIQVRPGARDGF